MYVVALHSLSPMDLGDDEGPSGVWESDVGGLVPCETFREVGEAIARRGSQDWAVFLLEGGRFLRRAVVFERDGITVQGVF